MASEGEVKEKKGRSQEKPKALLQARLRLQNTVKC